MTFSAIVRRKRTMTLSGWGVIALPSLSQKQTTQGNGRLKLCFKIKFANLCLFFINVKLFNH